MNSGIGGGLNNPVEQVAALLARLHFDGFVSGSQVVYKIPVGVSGGTVSMLKVIAGQSSMGAAGTAITYGESFAYTPQVVFGIEYNTVGASKAAPYAKDADTSGFIGVCGSTETVNWVAVGIHSESL